MKNRKILLHICCAPCLIYPFEKLTKDGFSARGFFFNPNIQPEAEYKKRESTLLEYASRINFDVDFSGSYKEDEFFANVSQEQPKPLRCRQCWYFRLKKTAEHAKLIGVDLFTTTLLVSPYQDTELLKAQGELVAKETGVIFYFYNFKEGYYEAVRIAKEKKLYRQNYCGCLFSLEERCKPAGCYPFSKKI
ncbi:MAG: epoxyqueuosine reductase QueH [Candidatus Omnitrophica bacterium]|nr:epoxyqueuosine reductase QueH [Candidatus Omnitrophota bacterium]